VRGPTSDDEDYTSWGCALEDASGTAFIAMLTTCDGGALLSWFKRFGAGKSPRFCLSPVQLAELLSVMGQLHGIKRNLRAAIDRQEAWSTGAD